jgi:UDP-N-acetylmuramate dehydrogenase
MDERQKEELVRLVGDAVRFDCPMAQYTTLRVGGKAEALYETNDLRDLRRVITYINEEHIPYLTVGRGSNILVKDAGISGLVILLRGSLAVGEIESGDESTVVAGAGLPIVDLLILCRDSGLGGLEFLAGIPGTVGGAVAMNAGAFGREIGTKVKEINVITRSGEVISKVRSQLKFSYRELEMEKGCVITRVSLNTHPESEKVVAERIAEHLKRRKEHQPLEYPSAGSVFKNPQKGHAGKLIENAGLKGKRIGGAMISDKHANFIVNTGHARAKDVLALLYMAQEKVKEETGIELQPEIQVVGD